MANSPEDRDLAFGVIDEAGFEDLLLVEDFDGDMLVCGEVASVVDLSEGTMAEELAELVFVEEDGLRFGSFKAACNGSVWDFGCCRH